MNIQHFLPLQKQLKQWKDRKKWVDIPLFNSYVFVYTCEKYRNEVFQVPGVIKYVSVKGQICTLKEEEIDRITRICNQEHEVQITSNNLLSGDEVEVTQGPLKGLKGKVSEKANNAFLYIQIENLGFTAFFKIDKQLLKRIV